MSNINYNFNKLTPFKFFCLTNFPFIEEDFDALTNYQLLCKVVEYLNNVIKTTNTIGTQTEKLTNAFNTLKSYVDNYFTNLDVQEEINNKLDQMAENGTLTNLIKSYLNPIITEQNQKINSLNNQLTEGLNNARTKNELITMADLSQDVKTAITGGSVAVVGENSVQNSNIVNNTISQTKMKDAILSEFGNLIEYDKCSLSKTLDNTGNEVDSVARDVSDFIPILGENYHVGNNNAYSVYYYTIDKTFISYQSPNTSNLIKLTIPENAKYFRVTMYKSSYSGYGQYPYVAINDDKYIGTFTNIVGTPTITSPLYTKNDIILADDNIKNNSINQNKFDTETFNILNKNPDFELTNLGNLFDNRLLIYDKGFTHLSTEIQNMKGSFITSYLVNIDVTHQYQCFTFGSYYIKWLDEDENEISVDILVGLKVLTPPENTKFGLISGSVEQTLDKTGRNYLQLVDRAVHVLTDINQVVDPIYKGNYLYTETSELYPELTNKKMVFFGDSWCAGNSSYPGGWASYIRSNTVNTVCENKGQNGSTWAQCYNNYLTSEKINDLSNDYDIICIEAFTNGLYTDTPYKTIGEVDNTLFNSIDEITSQMTDTICRDIELCLFQLAHKYVGKRICIIFPYQSRSQAYNNACFKDTIPLVKQIAQKYSIKIFDDFYTSNIPTFTRDYYWDTGEETEDEKIGTHLNELGYPIIGKNIIQHLNNWS